MAATAPYLCYNQREIKDGSIIRRPSGETGTVIFTGSDGDHGNLKAWVVDYNGSRSLLSTEVGSKVKAFIPVSESSSSIVKDKKSSREKLAAKVDAANAKAKEPEFKIQSKFEEHKGTSEKDLGSLEVMSEADEIAIFRDHPGGPWFEQFQLTNKT